MEQYLNNLSVQELWAIREDMQPWFSGGQFFYATDGVGRAILEGLGQSDTAVHLADLYLLANKALVDKSEGYFRDVIRITQA